ncbi:MAG: crossover junction endodeoxyribonuclease RuvC [Candidatus Magnetoovum sp. WYHC-5]|nr:crossover junction endodeoxyribonuclease RuvC [Candidatus Magnetoovum sp. WYHC-5]
MSEKVVIGIDPGSIVCGYGVLQSRGRNIIYITSGDIRLPKTAPLPIRLKHLYEGLTEVVEMYKPDEAVIEKIFYSKGVTSALNLGHARGVAMLCVSKVGIPVIEYSSLEVKKAVTGYGRADKVQVMEMVKRILNKTDRLTQDSGDALALALCHIQRCVFNLQQ